MVSRSVMASDPPSKRRGVDWRFAKERLVESGEDGTAGEADIDGIRGAPRLVGDEAHCKG